MHGQVEELVTGYGRIDLMWFDFSYDHMTGETWRATDLVRMIRRHQPHMIMDNRLEVSGEGFGSLLSGQPKEYAGDYVSPEQIIPPEGVLDINGKPVPWEACVTMNNHWGYTERDKFFKPAPMLIRKLVECVSKGGNLLLNVGPDARGMIPEQSLDILRQIGRWMKRNGESIYGCSPAGMDKPDFGRITRRGKTLYYHVFDNPIGYLPLSGLKPEQVESIRLLSSGAQMKIEKDWITNNYPDHVFTSFGPNPVLPDETDTVVAVRLKD
jgi:alpha-L-fucosidase